MRIAIHLAAREWSKEIESLFEKQNLVDDLPDIKKACLEKKFLIDSVIMAGVEVALILSRYEDLLNGNKELVIVHCISRAKTEIPTSSILSPVFEVWAKRAGAGSIRIHSDSRAMDRMLERGGYKFQESLFVKKLVE